MISILRQKRLVLAISTFLIAVLVAGGLLVWNKYVSHSTKKTPAISDTHELSNKEEIARPIQKPTGGIIPRTACDFFDEQLAKQAIGPAATKNDKLTAVQGLNYNSTVCEYVSGTSKATVTIYRHPDKAKIAATLSDVKSAQVSANSKKEYVVSANVASEGKFGVQKSDKLLDGILKKL